MTRFQRIMLAVAFVLSPAAMAQTAAPMTPAQAVAAAESGEVTGVFEFVVGSTGASGFNAYLNSAANYKDAGNLTIELHAAAINALKERLGAFPQDVLTGKRVRVKGVARRVPVGRYFQTRIAVDTADQIEIGG
ncbi:hypothetical protein [Sphingomonas hengshuiensis]|nr:hypothetical protein [Sphingomonas hengshuiensis]